MRKLLLIVALLLLAQDNVFAQDPNNHWQLGTSDVNFSTATPTVSTISNGGQHGNASISDSSGNLLFYTDGATIWNKNHQIMQNSVYLGYNFESEQQVIIVPYPGANKYYVISQLNDNFTGGGTTEDFHNYRYYIVDFTSNPLGQLAPIYYNGSTPRYVDELKDLADISNGYTIVGYGCRQGGLTYTKNNTGDGYWVILNGGQNNDKKIYSFAITATGLNQYPVVTNFTSALSNPMNRAVFKINPSNTKLGILESSDYTGATSKFHTMTFNSTTGALNSQAQVTNIVNGTLSASTFEFSNDSQKLYLAKTNLLLKDLSTPSVLARTITLPTLPNTSQGYGWHLEKDKYNELRLAANGLNYIKKIDNQNNYITAALSTGSITLSATFTYQMVLPQKITLLDYGCPNNLTISASVPSGTDFRQAASTIEATNTISNGAYAIYHAGNYVLLKPSFHAINGSNVHVYVSGCTGFDSKPASIPEETYVNQSDSKEEKMKLFTAAPNPNNGIFNIKINSNENGNLEISDLFGVTVFKSVFQREENLEVNLQNRPKGIYIVKLITGNQTYYEKIVKNQ